MNQIPVDDTARKTDIAAELRALQEQVEQARALLANLNEEAAALQKRRSDPQASELLSANEQLIVAALRSETRFRAYFDVSPEYLYLLRLTSEDDLVFEDVNPAGARLYGLSREQIVGKSPAELDSEYAGENINRHARLALRDGRPVTYELSRTFGSHARAIINTIVAPVEGSQAGGLVLVCGRDLTIQRHAEDALRQAQKMEAIGQLTGGIAHDFNNLLAAVMGSLELMNKRIVQGRLNELDRYVQAAQAASKRATALTHRLLAFSRRQTLSPKLTNIDRLVKGLEAFYYTHLERNR